MLKRLVSWVNGLTMKVRLAMLFGIVSIIPVIVIGLVSLRVSNDNLMEKAVNNSLNRLEFIRYRTVELMRAKHDELVDTAFNEYVRTYFDDSATPGPDNQRVVEDQVKRQLMRLYNKQQATSVTLIGQGGAGLVYGALQSSTVSMITDPARAAIDIADFRLFDRWRDANQEQGEWVIPYERLVLAISDNRPVALLIVNLRESQFRAFYRDYEQHGNAQFFIVNERGNILSCSDRQQCAMPIDLVLGVSTQQLEGDSGVLSVHSDVITYAHDANRGLWFFERTPAALINEGIWPIVQLTVLVALLSVIACVLLGWRLSRSFTRPLQRLIERISSSEAAGAAAEGGLTKNEIAILSDKYEGILQRLEAVIAEFYEEQRKKKEAQIRALEFQINPHFLYNTLSTIVWLIEAGEGKTAIRVTKNLSVFFRISISKGREYISLREEIHHIELYIDIQKARYQDSIFVSYELMEDAMALFTPKLILQPLVENSIIHAMQTRKEKTCAIRIRAWQQGNDVLLEVRDNGDTITQQTIDDMNQFLCHRDQVTSGADYGIGISNVHDRIVMCFGEGYGLSYRREDGETVAQLRIRALKEDESHV